MKRFVSLLAVFALGGCGSGSGTTTSALPADVDQAIRQAQTVIDNAARPVPAGPGFRIPKSAARGLHGLDLWNAIVDPMIDPLTPLDGRPELREKLNGPQYAVYVLFAIDTDYEDGGLWEVYYNNSGVFAREAVRLLKSVGAPLHGAVLARANRVIWPSGAIPATEAARRRVLTMADEPRFHGVNAAWALADHREGAIETVIERYIRAHPEAFFS